MYAVNLKLIALANSNWRCGCDWLPNWEKKGKILKQIRNKIKIFEVR